MMEHRFIYKPMSHINDGTEINICSCIFLINGLYLAVVYVCKGIKP